MRTSVLLVTKNSNLCGVHTNKGRGSIFRDFERTFYGWLLVSLTLDYWICCLFEATKQR